MQASFGVQPFESALQVVPSVKFGLVQVAGAGVADADRVALVAGGADRLAAGVDAGARQAVHFPAGAQRPRPVLQLLPTVAAVPSQGLAGAKFQV